MPRAHVNGTDLCYQIEGQGEPVLLLPGFGCDQKAWSFAAPPLARRYRVIRPDSRGTGNSDAPDSPTTMRHMADNVAALLDHIGPGPVHVVGHSMGGQVAQELALAHPDRVRSLTLLATWARPGPWLAALTQAFGDLPRSLDPQSYIRAILPWVYTEAFFQTPGAVEQVVFFWVTPPSPPAPHTLYHQSRAIMASDTAARLGGIRCPTLVLVGRQDILTPPRFSEELARLIPGARLAVLDGCGHNAMMETPAAVAGAILDFLGGQAPLPRNP